MSTYSQKLVNNWFNIYTESIHTNVASSGKYQYDYTVLMNSTMPHSGNVAVSLMNNLIFQEAVGSTSAYIKHNLKPFP